jgi:hypothetical protein
MWELQIAGIDHIEIDQAKGADPSRGQVNGRRAP